MATKFEIPQSLPVTAGDIVAVVGGGISGDAAVRLLHACGLHVRLLQRDFEGICSSLQHYIKENDIPVFLGEHSASQVQDVGLVVLSPGIPQAIKRIFMESVHHPLVIGEIDLALCFIQKPILAVTGTSGKTTTASLAAAMLERQGKKVFLGGNIGIPLSRYVLEGGDADILVLEMSSFQLQTCQMLHADIAVLLNIAENHLDYHADMEEYTQAKFRLFELQNKGATAILPYSLRAEFEKKKLPAVPEYLGSTPLITKLRLLGEHNAYNATAAYLACKHFGVTRKTAEDVAATFAPLRHRLEFVAQKKNVCFVNDSKGTTVEALEVALRSSQAPIVLLAGGQFKGGDLNKVRPLLRDKVKQVVLFGGSREVFMDAWKGCVPVVWVESLHEAFRQTVAVSTSGDTVLLSPATSSYDQYANYQERGDHFCSLVEELS